MLYIDCSTPKSLKGYFCYNLIYRIVDYTPFRGRGVKKVQ